MESVFWDALLATCSASTTFYLSYMGVRVSMHPPKKSDSAERKKLKKKFIGVGGVCVLLIAVQTIRASMVTKILLKNQNISVRLSKLYLSNYPQKLVPGTSIAVTQEYEASDDASGMKSRHDVLILDGPQSRQQEQQAYDYIQRVLEGPIPSVGTDQKAHVPWQVMARSRVITQDDFEKIWNNKVVVYSVGYIEWKNPSGSRSSTYTCRYLLAPSHGGDEMWPSCVAHASAGE